MNEKGIVRVVVVLVFLCFINPFSKVMAETHQFDSELTLTFEENQEIGSSVIKPPLIEGSDIQKPSRLLPQTGELLTSMIILLIGASLFIFSVGVISIRQLYKNTSWEV